MPALVAPSGGNRPESSDPDPLVVNPVLGRCARWRLGGTRRRVTL